MTTMKRPWPDGRTHLQLDPVEFLRKLAGIIPPPRAHLVRYHGVFAPRGRLRAAVTERVPLGSASASSPVPRPPGAIKNPRVPTRLSWAGLLKRVFAVDVLQCPCG
jgi:hypothetical protein